jgi:Transposase DDE domain
VSSYTLSSVVASGCVEDVGPGSGLAAMVVAVPLSALAWPVRQDSDGDGRSALVVTGAAGLRAGEPVAWCKIVAVCPAVLRRDGRVQADGRPCEHARLGAAEQELERLCGPGVIERIAAGVRLTGKIKGTARREMSVAFTMRAVLLMTLMPEADAREVVTTLLGELVGVPWRRRHAVPSSTVLSRWRAAIGPEPLQQLQEAVLAAVTAEHRDPALPAIEVGGGLRLGAIDGTLTRMPDTKPNRAAFGSTGTADDSAAYPQLRHLHLSDALTRATLGVVTGPAGGDKAEAEQALLDRALVEHPDVFGPDRLWIMDRNFPGVPRIKAILDTGSHVLIRVKSDIRLSRISGFASDGSYLARISGGGTTLTMRVVEYAITLDGQTTPELFCLITDLTDDQTHPGHLLADAYRWRWDGCETALREAKSTIADAGPATGASLRSHTPSLIHQEHAAWMTATELTRALLRSAAAVAAPLTKGPRTGQPVQPRNLSFTTTRRTLINTVRAGTATASLPAPARTTAYRTTLDTITTAKVTTDRHRHRDHKTKTRQAFTRAPRGITTRTAPAVIHLYGTTATSNAA